MASVSFSGLASGLDSNTLISQLMYLERAPERILESKKSTINSQIDIYNQVTNLLNSFKTLAAGMNTATGFMGKTTSVGDSTVATATSSSIASPGSYTLTVNSLAKNERQVVDQGYASADAFNFKTGTFTISGVATPITIAEGQNSLQGIASAINASGANVTASILNDGSANPYRLAITGKDTNNYTLDFSGLTGDPASGTAYATPTITKSGPAYQAGAAASFSVNGIAITKTSNIVTDVIPGVSLTLLKEGGATTTVTVGNDTAGVTKKINDFVGAYNAAMSQINKQSEYNATTKKGGVLSGDSTLRNVKTQLQNILTTPVAGITGKYSTLADIGITTDRSNGTLTVDATKLADALGSNFNDVVELFTKNGGVSNLDTEKYGVAEQFRKVIDRFTHAYEGPSSTANGIISSRVRGLNDTIKSIDDQIAAMEVRMERKEEALKKQFTAMETLVSSLTTQGNSLISYLYGS
ncbi:flagellar cap protein FliD [Geobacter sulfurreducens]|nr:flagellar cap protein FliD [Geobacter sulfurreducens]